MNTNLLVLSAYNMYFSNSQSSSRVVTYWIHVSLFSLMCCLFLPAVYIIMNISVPRCLIKICIYQLWQCPQEWQRTILYSLFKYHFFLGLWALSRQSSRKYQVKSLKTSRSYAHCCSLRGLTARGNKITVSNTGKVFLYRLCQDEAVSPSNINKSP